LLGIRGTLPELAAIGPRTPMLEPGQLLYFAIDNVEPFERQVIRDLGIAHVPLEEVVVDPAKAAATVASGWARQFERLLVHVDLDVLDFAQTPLAENTRRNVGLNLEQLMAALRELLRASDWTALTLCELNPDHGEADGSTLRAFVEALGAAVAAAPRWRPLKR
jgi:arginase